MKKMRRLIPAFAMLMVAAIMLSTASFAWFTIGTYATATGMSVTAEAASSLLIINGDVSFANGVGTEYTANDETNLRNALQDATNAVEFNREGANLQPATRYLATSMANKLNGSAPTNGLVTLQDATFVDQNTGTTLEGFGYKAAAEGTNYIEYTAYIAAAGIEMETSGNTLQATVTLPDNDIAYINKAVTIAFWVADSKNDTVAFEDDVNLLDVLADGSVTVDLGTQVIPSAVTTGEDESGNPTTTLDYVKVYMRVYYDGALEDLNTGKTYVRNEHIGASGAAFNIRFDYTTAPAESD